jgi:metal-responsive CopG/Arc/MetJ family transcriptional regulator
MKKDKKTVRTNIYIPASLMADLKKLSKQNVGAPVARLIRAALRAYVEEHLKD